MANRLLVATVVSLVIMTSVDASKILLLPIIARSHVTSILEISKALGRIGHQSYIVIGESFVIEPETEERAKADDVTFLRYRERNLTAELREILEYTMERIVNSESPEEVVRQQGRRYMGQQASSLLLDNEEFIEDLKSIGFDVTVVDSTFAARYTYLLAHRVGVQWIAYTDFPDPWLMRAPWLPSVYPGQFSTLPGEMNFWQRVQNVASFISGAVYDEILPFPVLAEYQRYGSFDSIAELVESSKLWLITSHPLLDYPRPLLPNMIEVGGLTTKPPKELPVNFKSFLDDSEEGVILLSFGSMFSFFPDQLLEKFLTVFQGLEKFRILWVLHNNMTNRQFPSHIRTDQWLDQNGVLGHPKMKLFITHCGNNGQFEALYHGVPMIGFPIAGDQMYNCHRMEYKGFGVQMNIRDFSSRELNSTIIRILSDSSFKTRISKASEIFRSEVQHPTDKAAYWIDHVIRYGSEHLKPPGKKLTFSQFFLFDVLSIGVLSAVLMLVVAKKVLGSILDLVIGSRVKQKLKIK